GPLQIIILRRAGIPVAKAFAGCLMGAVLTVVCLVSLNAGILLFDSGLRLEFGHHMRAVLSMVIIIFLFLSFLFVLSLFKIGLVKRIFGKITLFILRLIKKKRKLAVIKRLLRGLDQYSECMQAFAGKKKKRVFIACIITFLALFFNNLIGPVLLMGLNIRAKFPQIFLIQFVISFILYFSPTPGASGIAEFSNYWILSEVNVEQNMLGIYTVIWRFFMSFIGVSVGAIIVLSMLRSNKKKIL
ncbi:TPA: flippase-like domain-containing protein, partial [bacterium]|nr:flippase-like domain-containing protein [bacterium]